MRKAGLSIAVAVALVACGGGEGDPAAEEQGEITEALTGAVEKAEAVEDTAMEHKEAIDDALKEAEEDDRP